MWMAVIPIVTGVIILAGVVIAAVHVTQNAKKTRETVKENTATKTVTISENTKADELDRDDDHKNPHYWLAVVTKTAVISGRALSYSEAVAAAYSGRDILAINMRAARTIAKTHRIYVGYEKHGNNRPGYYLPHYHLCRSSGCAHIFFM